jgi:hypothetical protein
MELLSTIESYIQFLTFNGVVFQTLRRVLFLFLAKNKVEVSFRKLLKLLYVKQTSGLQDGHRKVHPYSEIGRCNDRSSKDLKLRCR